MHETGKCELFEVSSILGLMNNFYKIQQNIG